MDDIRKVVAFDSVEEFWGLYNNIVPPSQLPGKANYYLFKVGLDGLFQIVHTLMVVGRDHASLGGSAEQERWEMGYTSAEGQDEGCD